MDLSDRMVKIQTKNIYASYSLSVTPAVDGATIIPGLETSEIPSRARNWLLLFT